jgi:hypothetical protein
VTMPKETRVPECKCPNCGAGVDAATNLFGKGGPEPGDISICLYCGCLMKFKDDMMLRRLTGAELIEVLKDDRVAAIERARQHVVPPPGEQKIKP